MKGSYFILTAIILMTMFSCSNNKLTYKNPDARILFLHHSTGLNVWKGELLGLAKFSSRLGPSMVPSLLKEYNKKNSKKYAIYQQWFPTQPYSIDNNPYDYYNLWVNHAGDQPYLENSTLEMLTSDFDVIIFKHCFPYSHINPDDSIPDINSTHKTIANYTLQYNALKNKLHMFPRTKFIIWTGAALVEKSTTPEEAIRAQDFRHWVIEEWDEPGDNIYIFDFNGIETGDGLYMKPEYAVGPEDSHPNETLSKISADLFVKRIIEVIENNK